MIDIHCHILHGIDDGPAVINESLALARMAEENCIQKIVLTPHLLRFDAVEKFIDKRDKKIRELRALLSKNDINIELYAGAEVFISDDLFYTNEIKKLTINQSRYLLTEFKYSNLNEKRLRKYIDELLSQEIIPIIAHPERYQYFQSDRRLVEIIAQSGSLYQVNADALCGFSSRAEGRLANDLVSSGLASFIATDAHSLELRPNNLLEIISKYLPGADDLLYGHLVNDNPAAVLRNEPVSELR